MLAETILQLVVFCLVVVENQATPPGKYTYIDHSNRRLNGQIAVLHSVPVGPEDPISCGRQNKKTLVGNTDSDIIHGETTKAGQWPWMAMITYPPRRSESKTRTTRKLTVFCGGTLLGNNWIVTAAHCVNDMQKPTDKVVYLGVDKIRIDKREVKPNGNIQLRNIAAVYIHPKYNTKKALNYDVALIKLSSPAIFNDRVNSICLPKVDEIEEDTELKIAGWGRNSSGRILPDRLLEGKIYMKDHRECEEKYPAQITKSMVCAGGERSEMTTDTCSGDSGGPLMYKRNNKWEIVGITSWGGSEMGPRCGDPNYPGVYASVTLPEVNDWIKQVTHNQREEDRLKFRDSIRNLVNRSVVQIK